IDLAQLRHDLFGFVLLLGHSNVLLRLNSLLQGGPLFRGQTTIYYAFVSEPTITISIFWQCTSTAITTS
ncbi:hypothetical protein, partial [Burkholderia cenocepacia]|uniref:hypothetical protein n=1 Tax=Burkholderia cenocepacia TaxID=95486 RepID=UPI001B934F22